MLLAIDIGNSNIVFGTFKEGHLIQHHRVETNQHILTKNDIQQKLDLAGINQVVVASVVPEYQKPIVNFCQNHIPQAPVIHLNNQFDFHFDIDVQDPDKVGIDRLLNSAAALEKYKTDLIVIDLGTATTIDCVTKDPPKFLGGLICPGLHLSADSLFTKASQLFPVPYHKPEVLIGKNTKECLQAGIYYGYLDMIDGLVDKIKKNLNKKMTVVATGGLSSLFKGTSIHIDYFDEHLTLEGMNFLARWNQF